MKIKKLIAGCLSLMLLGSMTACSAKPDDKSSTTKGGEDFTLRVGIALDPNVIDPAIARSNNAQTFVDYLFEGLVRSGYEDDGAAVIQMGQAKSYSVSDDGLTYRFELRDDIFWSDEKPVVAEDFVYAWQRLVDPKTDSSYGSFISMVENAKAILAGEKATSELGVKAVDKKTFEVKLAQKCPYFIDMCAVAATFPVRKDIVEADSEKWYENPKTCISNGAYVLKEWKSDDKLVLSKNDKYYDAKIIGPKTLDFTVVGDHAQALTLFTNKQLDVLWDINRPITTTMKGTEQLLEYPFVGLMMVYFNNQEYPFNDPDVRQAFSLAIDRNTLVGDQSDYAGTPMASIVPGGMPDAETSTDFRKKTEYYFSVKPEDYAENCKKAKELLAKAGFENGENFPTVRFLYNDVDSDQKQVDILAKAWEDVLGVKVEKVSLKREEWMSDIRANKYDLSLNSWIADYNDPTTFLDLFESNSSLNIPAYNNPVYDATLLEAAKANTPEERFAALHKAEDILLNDSGVAPLFNFVSSHLVQDNVDGVEFRPIQIFSLKYVQLK